MSASKHNPSQNAWFLIHDDPSDDVEEIIFVLPNQWMDSGRNKIIEYPNRGLCKAAVVSKHGQEFWDNKSVNFEGIE